MAGNPFALTIYDDEDVILPEEGEVSFGDTQMSDVELAAALHNMVSTAEDYREQRMATAAKAQEYFDGVMNDTPHDDNRSKVKSLDLRAAFKKAMPSIFRTILGGDVIAEYLPVGDGDDKKAEERTVYINNIVVPEAKVHDTIYDGIADAMVLRNGVLQWWHEEKISVSEKVYSGMDDRTWKAFSQRAGVMIGSTRFEIVEHSPEPTKVIAEDATGNPVLVDTVIHSARIRKYSKQGRIKTRAIPLEKVLISPELLDVQDGLLAGFDDVMSRSDLVALGYDRAQIDALPIADRPDDWINFQRETRERWIGTGRDVSSDLPKANQLVDYRDLYVRIDYDGDGIAELRRICIAGPITAENILVNELVEDVQMCDIRVERRPHQWEGHSFADDIMPLQQIKTVLLRQTLDNIYWSNNLQMVVALEALENPDSVINRNFGEPIIVKAGTDVSKAVQFLEVPMVAEKSFNMLAYVDEMITDRTGINDASGGLPPDALQNMTAKASAIFEQAGLATMDMTVRTIARCLHPFFIGLAKLVQEHQDTPRRVRLGQAKEPMLLDPASWEAECDVKVNTGLGTGTRERDMIVMQTVMTLQEKIIAGMGADNPFVKPENIYNALEKFTQAAGLQDVRLYFTKPDPAEVEAKMKALKERPSEHDLKAAAQIKVENAKGEVTKAVEAKKAEEQTKVQIAQMNREAVREREQAANDVKVELAKLSKEQAIELEERRSKVIEHRQQMEAEKYKADREAEQKKLDRESREKIEFAKLGVKRVTENAETGEREIEMAAGQGKQPVQDQIGKLRQLMERDYNERKEKSATPKPKRKWTKRKQPDGTTVFEEA